MKNSESEQISTIPDGVWEAGVTDESLRSRKKVPASVDAQGNGYPVPQNTSPHLPSSSASSK